MAFEPFGSRFDLTYSQPRNAATAAIRAKLKGWFDPKRGVRGWIAGPILYLWSNPYDSTGPALFGWISSTDTETRIRGRAGYNLAAVMGVALAALPLLGFLGLMAFRDRIGLLIAVVALLFYGVFCLLIAWSAHAWSKEAEPLIRFLRTICDPPATKRNPMLVKDQLYPGMILWIDGANTGAPPTLRAIQEALENLEVDDFVILENEAGGFIQTARSLGDAYVLEVRQQAKAPLIAASGLGGDLVAFDDVWSAFQAFASGGGMPATLNWVQVPD